MRRLRREESGFTIVEAMIAAMVLMLGLVPIVGVFDSSRDQSRTGERHEIAVLQAEQALEELRGLPYNRLMMNAGAVDPSGERLGGGGSTFTVRDGLSERLVYHTTEGQPVADAWVNPVATVQIGDPDVERLELTIHHFVTWRDEECRVANLDGLGISLPSAIDQAQVPLLNLVNTVLNNLLGLLSGSDRQEIQTLRNRLIGLRDAFNSQEANLATAVNGITELDLCDINLSALADLQELGRLTPGLSRVGGLTTRLTTLSNAFGGICLPIVGCLLGSAQDAAVNAVNTQLNCMFGSSTDTTAEFSSYLTGIQDGLATLAGDLSDTDRNTKRITVAVVIEPQPGAGPVDPVWASSVVRDPSAGLLSSAGAAC